MEGPSDGRVRYADVERGDFSDVDRVVSGTSGERATVHRRALNAYLWFAGQGGRLPSEEEVAIWPAVDGEDAASRALVLAQRARLLEFDLPAVERLAHLADRLSARSAAARDRLVYVRLLAEAVRPTDEPEALAQSLGALFERVKRAALPALVVDVQCARALAAMLRDDLESATALTRRASRMARTEGLPQQQYLANLLLARVRRLNGVPHLATHILNALAGIATAPYQGWLRWERLLAGAVLGDVAPARSLAERAAVALDATLSAAERGDAAALARDGAALLAQVESVPWVRPEARDLVAALDPNTPSERASPAMRDWLEGRRPLPPHGLYGRASGEDADSGPGRDTGYVVVGPDRPVRRVLGSGATEDDGVAHDARRTDRRRLRVETGVAVLALANPAEMATEAFFRAVYGFAFNPAVHPAVLDALVSRMRKLVGDAGTLTRQDGVLSLAFRRPVTLPDPRCAQPLEQRVLRVLVRAQRGTAKDAAARLGLPLRTVQEALKELTEAGACLKQREGRAIAYLIEDTTFAPPTQHGVG